MIWKTLTHRIDQAPIVCDRVASVGLVCARAPGWDKICDGAVGCDVVGQIEAKVCKSDITDAKRNQSVVH